MIPTVRSSCHYVLLQSTYWIYQFSNLVPSADEYEDVADNNVKDDPETGNTSDQQDAADDANTEDFEAYQANNYTEDEDNEQQATAPGSGCKRARSLTTEAVDSVRSRVACRINNHSGRVCHKDYDEETRPVIEGACEIYCCFLSTVYAFPDRGTEIDWAHEVWDESCKRNEISLRMTPELAKLVHGRPSQLQLCD